MTEEELAQHDSATLLQLLLSADARCDALTAERDRLREALKPFAFFFDDDGEAKTMQQAWEIIYRDRVEDWVFHQEIAAARAALKGETP